ncbi:helix-turn-helix domain-containing protein, partial [Streptomyces sp. P17]|uniref:helix-turn-helix domain-containing protein n=1 Tax=Streptomyces sp. P17 TaxID=3074716 RepID=UPI0028F3FBEC
SSSAGAETQGIVAEDLPAALEQHERKMITTALAQSGGNRTEAARKLGIHRQLLHTKMTKYGLT